MPSVLDQKFRHRLTLDCRHREVIEKYCEKEIGYRSYYLRQYRGGKHWRIQNQPLIDAKMLVELDDDGHATILALKYAT